MVILCFTICFVCCAHCNICQNGRSEYQHQSCHRNTDACNIDKVWCIVMAKGEAKGINTLSKQNITFLIISGLGTGLSWLFYFKALQLGNVSQVAPVDKLSVALTIIMAILFLGEPLTLKTFAGASLIILGTVILAWK